MTYVTSLRDIATAALARHAQGMLGYQNPKNHNFECRYRYDDGRACAIGAGLPDDVAAIADACVVSTVAAIQNERVIEITDDFEIEVPVNVWEKVMSTRWYDGVPKLRASTLLQFLHDDLCEDGIYAIVQESHLVSFLQQLANGERPEKFAL